MGKTKIEWVRNPDGTSGVVWNPVTGCSKVSEGCRNCYAESLAHRFRKDFRPWTAANAEHNVRLHPERLEQPLHWSKPRRVFVNSVSDLFHEEVPDEFILEVFGTMVRATEHTFQILTKRPKRMLDFIRSYGNDWSAKWPLLNVWLGISAEDQPTFDERTKYLLQTPAAVRFVSLEPLLGSINAVLYLGGRSYRCGCGYKETESEMVFLGGDVYWCADCETRMEIGATLDWVIVGGESGPGARPMHPDWVRAIRDQCQAAGVPFFFKQWGMWAPPTVSPFPRCYHSGDVIGMLRVGKKAAGNELDGRTWEEMPK